MNGAPTIPVWAVALIRDLTAQLDRLYSGLACRECRGSGELVRGGKAGVYVCACHVCDGHGVEKAGHT